LRLVCLPGFSNYPLYAAVACCISALAILHRPVRICDAFCWRRDGLLRLAGAAAVAARSRRSAVTVWRYSDVTAERMPQDSGRGTFPAFLHAVARYLSPADMAFGKPPVAPAHRWRHLPPGHYRATCHGRRSERGGGFRTRSMGAAAGTLADSFILPLPSTRHRGTPVASSSWKRTHTRRCAGETGLRCCW
jgi:hypothetical protein